MQLLLYWITLDYGDVQTVSYSRCWVPLMVLCTDGVRAEALFLLLALLCHRNEHYMKQRHHVNCECESICNLVCLQGWIMWPQPERRPTLTILQGSEPYKWLILCFLFSCLIDNTRTCYYSAKGTPKTVITVRHDKYSPEWKPLLRNNEYKKIKGVEWNELNDLKTACFYLNYYLHLWTEKII